MIDKNYIATINKRLRELNPVQPCANKQYGIQAGIIWRARNPEKCKAYRQASQARRRAVKIGCEGKHSAKEWLDKKSQYGFRCAYCHKKLRRLTTDHIVPLSKGGTDYIYNIVPACKHCNSSKHNYDLSTWRKFTGLQLPLSMS